MPEVDVTPRLMYDVPTAARMLSVSRSTVFDMLRRNELSSVRIRTRRLIAHSDLVGYIRLHRTEETTAALVEGAPIAE